MYKMWLKKNNQIISVVKSGIYEHYNAPRQIFLNLFSKSNFEFFNINNKIKIKSISGKKLEASLLIKKTTILIVKRI